MCTQANSSHKTCPREGEEKIKEKKKEEESDDATTTVHGQIEQKLHWDGQAILSGVVFSTPYTVHSFTITGIRRTDSSLAHGVGPVLSKPWVAGLEIRRWENRRVRSCVSSFQNSGVFSLSLSLFLSCLDPHAVFGLGASSRFGSVFIYFSLFFALSSLLHSWDSATKKRHIQTIAKNTLTRKRHHIVGLTSLSVSLVHTLPLLEFVCDSRALAFLPVNPSVKILRSLDRTNMRPNLQPPTHTSTPHTHPPHHHPFSVKSPSCVHYVLEEWRRTQKGRGVFYSWGLSVCNTMHPLVPFCEEFVCPLLWPRLCLFVFEA